MFNKKKINKNTRNIITLLFLLSLILNSLMILPTNLVSTKIENTLNNKQQSSNNELKSSPLEENNNSVETNQLFLRDNDKANDIIQKNLKTNKDNKNTPEINLLKEDYQGLVIDFTMSDVITENFIDNTGENYQKIDIIGGGHLSEIGKPQIPTKGVYLDVPKSVDLEVIVKNSKYYEEFGYNVYPSQEIVPENDDEIDRTLEKNSTIYEENKFFPNNLVELEEIGIIRGHRTALLVIFPVAYNPVTKIMRVYHRIEIEIKYVKNDNGDQNIDQIQDDNSRYNSEDYNSFFESIFLNYDSSLGEKLSEISNIECDGADYLIITPDGFYDEILPLAQHKSNKGLLTKIVNLSTIDINPTADNISDYIQEAYDSWTPAPTYLLLVGDSELLPPHYKTIHPYHYTLNPTDLYYATVDGEDYFPDLFMGRLPVKTEAELNIVVNKIINYEINFNQNDPWRRNVLLAAYDQSGRYFIDTCENISSYLETIDYNITKVYTGGSYSGTTEDVIDTINNGTFLVNHRDHGEWYGWGDPSFTVDDIDDLNNGDMLPVMFSINCLSGRFDYTQDCFAEAILKAENKGVVGCIGSTRVSYSGYNDELDKGFIAAIWPDYQSSYNNYVDKSANLGQILNFGKMYMYDKYYLTGGAGYPWTPSQTTTKIEFEMFTLFGDPELSLLQVDHDLKVSMEVPNDPIISETYDINATVKNTGKEMESDIEFYLYYETEVVKKTDIGYLLPGQSYTMQYKWTPNTIGLFNFTAFAPPNLDEFYLSNNLVTKLVLLKRDLNVDLELPLRTYANNSYIINAFITNDGNTYENDVDFYLKLNDNIINYTSIPTLNPDENYRISYNWTPTEYGFYNFSCHTPLRIDEYDTNNNFKQENRTINPIIFKDDFEKGRVNWKNIDGLWHFTSIDSPWSDPCHSPTHAMWFGKESTGNFQTGLREYGSFISNPINLSNVNSAYVNFYHWLDGESLSYYDNGYVYISTDGINWDEIYRKTTPVEPWENINLNISNYCGNDKVYLRFYFDTRDSLYNYYRGWLIDDIEIYTDDYDYVSEITESPPKPPSLTDESIIPRIGNPDTLFIFRVNYTDIDNEAPSQINLILNGTLYELNKQDNVDYDFTDGCIYEYSTLLTLNPYNYTYYFNCSDGTYPITTSIHNDLKVHLIPTLNDEIVTPKIGYENTLITFRVNYTDLDNEAPLQVSIVLNGIFYIMDKENELDVDYTDGCIYEISIYLSPQANNYSYYFYCTDDGINSIITSIYNDLRIHSKPILTNGYVWPQSGYSDNLLTFRVTYTDLDNDAPTQISLIINDISYILVKYNTYDSNYADGCIYINSTYLPISPYNYVYYFNCSDGEHSYTTSIRNDLRVHSKPTLAIESVTPKIGYEDTLITFKVIYTDLDNDAPTQINVMINYSFEFMYKEDNSDNNYIDGCIYLFSTYLSLNSYNYTYQFYYSDDISQFLQTETYEDLKIIKKPIQEIGNGNDSNSENNKSNEVNKPFILMNIALGSLLGITSFVTLYYIKKRDIKIFKLREKDSS